MDLSNVEGLSDEHKAAIMALHDADVTGLKAKADQLLSEKKGVQADSDGKDAALEDARKAAVDAKEKQLLSENKYEEAQALREEERAKLVAEANANADKANSALIGYHNNTAKADVLVHVDDRFKSFAGAMLDKSMVTTIDEQGQAKTVFKNGDNEYSNASDFLDGVKDDDSWNAVLKGADSSGAGTKQSNNNGDASSSGTDKAKAALTQRLKSAGVLA